MKLSTKLILGFGFILLMFTIVAFIKIELSEKVYSHFSSVSSEGDKLRQSALIQKQIFNLETGLRSYLLTKQSESLDPFNNTLSKIPHSFDKLRMLVSQPDEIEKIDKIEKILYRWVDSIATPLINGKTLPVASLPPGFDNDYVLRKKILGLKTLDTLKQHFAAFDSLHNHTREMNKNIMKASLDETDRLTILLTLMSILAATIIAWLIIRSFTKSLNKMVIQAERITKGKFDMVLPQNRGDELTKLVNSLNTMNERLHESFNELERSNKELEQFAYVASHDLREPLRSVSSFSRLLSKKIKDQADEETHQYIQFINDGAARMERLIADLLEYSRVGTQGGDFSKVDMNNVIRAALQNLSAAISESGAKITYTDLPQVQGDETQLIQLFQNLIANAIKFRPKNKITQIKIGCKAKNDKFEFSVSDNGIGIPESQRERIFMIFQRLHTTEEYQGSGIGLAVCKKIVERHGGKIWCTASPEGGTTFAFTLKNDNQALN